MTKTDPPSFLPLTRPQIDADSIDEVAAVLRSGWLTSGTRAEAFEQVLSDFFLQRPVRCFANGTASLEAGLRIAGVSVGDEVITTPLSWVATANTILAVGAVPVFADIDPITRNLDMQAVAKKISPRTKAIVPVHLAGFPVDTAALYALAQQHGLRVIEDAAQAIGARWDGKPIGATGDIISFSFQASKNITAAEGGCLVLNDASETLLAEKLRLQGVVRDGLDGMEVDLLGGKANLSDVHAAIGLGQWRHRQEMQARRKHLAQAYFSCFADSPMVQLGLELPLDQTIARARAQGNWHLFQILLPLEKMRMTRAEIMQQLKDQGIGTGVHYPPIHLFKLYRARGFGPGMYPIAERIGQRILSLPLFPSMQDTDVMRVVQALAGLMHQS
jgi:dTDP-4-amino-4,6-dideoxygalactose transaminase